MVDYLKRMEEYSWLGSWAIWENKNGKKFAKEEDVNEEISFDKYESKLQPSNYVILGLNPGNIINNESGVMNHRKKRKTETERPWRNFHNVGRSRDYLLAEAIRGTILEGSYMTDLFPIYNSDSFDFIKRFIKNREKEDVLKTAIKEFDEEMSLLVDNTDIVRLICIGGAVYDYANKYLVENKLNLDLKRKYEVYKFYHYSGRNLKVSSKEDSDIYYPNIFKKTIEEYGLK